MTTCDCIHPAALHCPYTYACLYTNPTFGPCPCAATPNAVRQALNAAHHTLREAMAEERRKRDDLAVAVRTLVASVDGIADHYSDCNCRLNGMCSRRAPIRTALANLPASVRTKG